MMDKYQEKLDQLAADVEAFAAASLRVWEKCMRGVAA